MYTKNIIGRRKRLLATAVGVIGTWVAYAAWTVSGSYALVGACAMTFVQIYILVLTEE